MAGAPHHLLRLAFAVSVVAAQQAPLCPSVQGQFCANHCEGNSEHYAESLEECQKICMDLEHCTGGYWHGPFDTHSAICKLYGKMISEHECCDEAGHGEGTFTFLCRGDMCPVDEMRPSCSDTCSGGCDDGRTDHDDGHTDSDDEHKDHDDGHTDRDDGHKDHDDGHTMEEEVPNVGDDVQVKCSSKHVFHDAVVDSMNEFGEIVVSYTLMGHLYFCVPVVWRRPLKDYYNPCQVFGGVTRDNKCCPETCGECGGKHCQLRRGGKDCCTKRIPDERVCGWHTPPCTMPGVFGGDFEI